MSNPFKEQKKQNIVKWLKRGGITVFLGVCLVVGLQVNNANKSLTQKFNDSAVKTEHVVKADVQQTADAKSQQVLKAEKKVVADVKAKKGGATVTQQRQGGSGGDVFEQTVSRNGNTVTTDTHVRQTSRASDGTPVGRVDSRTTESVTEAGGKKLTVTTTDATIIGGGTGGIKAYEDMQQQLRKANGGGEKLDKSMFTP